MHSAAELPLRRPGLKEGISLNMVRSNQESHFKLLFTSLRHLLPSISLVTVSVTVFHRAVLRPLWKPECLSSASLCARLGPSLQSSDINTSEQSITQHPYFQPGYVAHCWKQDEVGSNVIGKVVAGRWPSMRWLWFNHVPGQAMVICVSMSFLPAGGTRGGVAITGSGPNTAAETC